MISTNLARFGLAASLAAILPAVPAQAALLTRTFVSAAGSDSNPCTLGQPCATFAHAYTLTAANGIIAALDPGKYGPLTITQPVTVNGNGWAAITGPAGGTAITINAGSGNVALIGLEIDGAAASDNGIVFNTGGSLLVTNCTVQNFLNLGIVMQPISGSFTFTITNSVVSNNGTGVAYKPASGSATANGLIDHVVANNNGADGIHIDTESGGGSTAVDISYSVANFNLTNDGIFLGNGGASLAVSIDNTAANSNGNNGIEAHNTVNVNLGRSVITANVTGGVDNLTAPNTFFSYGDNRIDGNHLDFPDSALNTHALH